MKVTKEQLKQIIKEELERMDAADEKEADEEVDLAGLIDDLGSLDLVKDVLQAVARDIPDPEYLAGLIDDLGSLDLVKKVLQSVAAKKPEFAASFKSYYDYFMSE